MVQVYSSYNPISLSSLWKPELMIDEFGGWEPNFSKWNSQTPNFHLITLWKVPIPRIFCRHWISSRQHRSCWGHRRWFGPHSCGMYYGSATHKVMAEKKFFLAYPSTSMGQKPWIFAIVTRWYIGFIKMRGVAGHTSFFIAYLCPSKTQCAILMIAYLLAHQWPLFACLGKGCDQCTAMSAGVIYQHTWTNSSSMP